MAGLVNYDLRILTALEKNKDWELYLEFSCK